MLDNYLALELNGGQNSRSVSLVGPSEDIDPLGRNSMSPPADSVCAMSLTGHLKDAKSPVNRFFLDNLPNTKFRDIRLIEIDGQKKSLRSEESSIAHQPKENQIWEPGEVKVLPSEESNFPWSTVGIAFDYRVRYFFNATPVQDFVAFKGARAVGAYFGTQEIPKGFSELQIELDKFAPELGSTPLAPKKELRLCRLCYVLALYEEVFRSPYGIDSPLGQRGIDASLEELVALCSDGVANDLMKLGNLFRESHGYLLGQVPAILNPNFGASRMLGGADADLIVGHRLIDIKTTKVKPAPGRQYLWQLAGYVLSDLENEFEIAEVGFYFSRHGRSITWSVEEFFNHLAGKKVNIEKMRRHFEVLLLSETAISNATRQKLLKEYVQLDGAENS